jgi:alanyl-tRNA synthetase
MALAASSNPGCIVVLTSVSMPSLAVVARSRDVPAAANRLLASLISRFGGRGGGTPELAQGGGLEGPADDILAAALAELEKPV